MRVTFGIVNCNRLFYLKACLSSLLKSTMDYSNKQIIVVDNASIEPGTQEYLDEIEKIGVLTVRNKKRDPTNEFAVALNKIVEISDGEIVCPLSGDLQFGVKENWLQEYVEVFKKRNDIGSIMLDAQRKITNSIEHRTDCVETSNLIFQKNLSRPPIATSGNSLFLKETLKKVGPWCEDNKNHEGTDDSETKMLMSTLKYLKDSGERWYQYQTNIPMTIMISNDPRGTNARIRGEKRYGKYVPGIGEEGQYYQMKTFKELKSLLDERNILKPIPYEKFAKPIGWSLPLDEKGNLKKNPIRVEDCSDDDWVFIDPAKERNRKSKCQN